MLHMTEKPKKRRPLRCVEILFHGGRAGGKRLLTGLVVLFCYGALKSIERRLVLAAHGPEQRPQ